GNGLRDHRRELPAELPDGAGSSRKTACARSPGRRRHRPTRDDPRARHRRGSLLRDGGLELSLMAESRTPAERPASRSLAMARERARDFFNLTKPGITRLILITTGVGFYMAQRGAVDFVLLFHTLLGTALACSG